MIVQFTVRCDVCDAREDIELIELPGQPFHYEEIAARILAEYGWRSYWALNFARYKNICPKHPRPIAAVAGHPAEEVEA